VNVTVSPHASTEFGPLNTDPIPASGAAVTTFVEPEGSVRFYRIDVQKE
jgi:hypothetical protein